MAPGKAVEGDHAGQGSQRGRSGIWQVRPVSVRVFAIRTFEDIVINRQPADDGSKAAATYNFFQKLVGINSRSVVSINIRAQPGKSRCDCGAVDRRSGTTERLSALCNCRGGTGTIVFSDEASATTFIRQIKVHHGLHARGFLSRTEINGVPGISLCDDCCLFGKQVGCTSRRPSLAGEEMVNNEDNGNETPILVTEYLTSAISTLFSGILRGQCSREVEDVKRMMLGKSITEARALAETRLRDLLISLQAPEEPVELLFFSQGWELVLQATPATYGQVARDFIQLLNAKDPTTHKSLLEETRAHHSDRDAIRLRLTPGTTVNVAPGPAERPLELVEAGQGGLVLANTPVIQNTAVIEVNETNLVRFLDRLDKAIKENSAGRFVGSEFEIQAMIDSKMEVMSAFNIITKMFQG